MSIDTIIKDQVLSAKSTEADSIIYAFQMKEQFPNKQDYGYGKAGHTLDTWEEMKEAFLLYGPKSYAYQSHKMISQSYRKRVGAVVDEIVAKSSIDSSYLGHYCWSGTVHQFIHTTKAQWLAHMADQYKTVSPFILKNAQKNAWSVSCSALKAALCKTAKLKNALLVFEYALPHSIKEGIVKVLVWPDALIVTDKKIMVLEFKNMPLENDEIIKKDLSQAHKYKRRLEKYHIESAGKQIGCILVSTLMHDAFKIIGGDVFCSGNMLKKALTATCPEIALPFDQNAWLNSTYSGIM